MKVSELEGAELDMWVAKAENRSDVTCNDSFCYLPDTATNHTDPTIYSPSTDWSQGGPIIEREDISFRKYHNPKSAVHGTYYAMVSRESGTTVHWKGWGAETKTGPTPLIAAMRALVASKYGDETP